MSNNVAFISCPACVDQTSDDDWLCGVCGDMGWLTPAQLEASGWLS